MRSNSGTFVLHRRLGFVAELILVSATAYSAPLDPNSFSSIGTLSLSTGAVTFNTDTLTVSGGFSGAGILHPQGLDGPEVAVFTFDEVSISSAVTLNLIGSRPIAILSKGDVMVDAAINARGNNGVGGGTTASSGNGGAGKLGGGKGGGKDGLAMGEGAGGSFLGGSGGGFGGAGGLGGRNISQANLPGQSNSYGDLLVALEGGSGGGRIVPSAGSGSGGGGAGGGGIEIGAVGAVSLGQGIDARGGTGGPSGGGSDNYGGGGGSGGGIILHGATIVTGGSLNASAGGGGAGAAGGGGGGGGRILLAPSSFTIGTHASFNTNVSAGNNNFSTGTNMVDGEPGAAGTVRIAPRRTIIPTGQSLLIDGSGSSVLDARTTLISTQHRVEGEGALFASAAMSSPHDVELAGGVISAPFGWTMTGEALLSGFGQLNGAVTGGAANVLVATGGVLTVGDTQKNSGFAFAGRIEVGNGNSLNLLDADVAELGFQTTLADTGRLNSLNGVRLGNGEILTAVATAEIGGEFTNEGTVEGPAVDGQFLTFTDDVNGPGGYTGNIVFSDGFSTGSNAAVVSMENAAFDSTAELQLKIGGVGAGTEHDVLDISGTAELGGTLTLELVEGFEPNAGDVFDLMNWGERVGTFVLVFLPSLDNELSWNTTRFYTEGVLSIALPGDFNFDGSVDAADYVVWRKSDGTQQGYETWRANVGRTLAGSGSSAGASAFQEAVPEPSALQLLFAWLAASFTSHRWRKCASPIRVARRKHNDWCKSLAEQPFRL